MIRPVAFFCLWCIGSALWGADSGDSLAGRPVVEIRFAAQGGGTIPAPPAGRLAIKVGDAYSETAIHDTISNLYYSGRYHQIEVDAQQVPAGLVLTFILDPNFFVGAVHVDGVEEPPTEGQLDNTTKLELGELFTQGKIDRAKAGILELLKSNGYYQAAVEAHLERQNELQQVNVHFQVRPGPRARIQEVKFEGDLGFPEAKLAAKARLKPGVPATGQRIQDAVQRLRKFYQKQDRLASRVELAGRRYLPEKNMEVVVIRATAGPQVLVRIHGERISGRTERALLPIYEEGAVDADLITEGSRNLRDNLQAQGYYEAEVTDKREDDPQSGAIHIDYQIERGKRHRLDQLEIRGNKFFDNDTLKERMSVTPKSRFGGGRFSRDLLDQDALTIRELYRTNGFQQAQVLTEVEDDYQGHTGLIHVRVNISEGPQTLVGKLLLRGNQGIPAAELQSVMAHVEGQSYSEYNAALDRDNVLAYYFDRGYRDATFAWKVTPLPGQANRVAVEYDIDEGQEQFVKQVIIAGEEFTRPKILEREVTLTPGEPLSQAAVQETQRGLYNLGVLSKVDLAVQNPLGEETDRVVLLQVEEARRWTLTTGIGAEVARIGGGVTTLDNPEGATAFAPRLSFDVTRLNFRGLNHTLFLKTRVSTLQQRALLGWTAPRVFNSEKYTLYLNLLQDHTLDVRTFTTLRTEGSAAISDKLNRSDTLIWRMSYRRVVLSDLKIDPSLIPQFNQAVRIAMPSVTFIRDRRDNPADSHKGQFISADYGIAASGLGSEANFNRLAVQYTTYHAFGKNLVLARSTQLGIAEPYGGLRQVGSGSNTTFTREIPLAERFFSGGGNSHRGFAVNQAGPRDPVTGFPVGGAALFINSEELRFPVRKPDLSAVLFHDAGNVYTKIGNLSFRVRQRAPDLINKTENDFNYMVHAVGIGFRYNTPIGPVRVDFAYSINPPQFYGVHGTVNDLVTRGFSLTDRHLQRLDHFQFFFSIGQTY